jgi:hypothetical protein
MKKWWQKVALQHFSSTCQLKAWGDGVTSVFKLAESEFSDLYIPRQIVLMESNRTRGQ